MLSSVYKEEEGSLFCKVHRGTRKPKLCALVLPIRCSFAEPESAQKKKAQLWRARLSAAQILTSTQNLTLIGCL